MAIFETLGIDSRVLLIQIVTFGVLFFLLRRFLFGPVAGLLAARSKEVEQRLDTAQQHEASAAGLRQELEDRLAAIADEARQKMQEAVQEARATREQLLGEAKAEAERVLVRAQEEIRNDQRRALLDLKNEVAEMAIAAAQKAVAAGLDESKHRQAINDFLMRLEAQAP